MLIAYLPILTQDPEKHSFSRISYFCHTLYITDQNDKKLMWFNNLHLSFKNFSGSITDSCLAPLLDIAPQDMAAAISREEAVAVMAVEAADRDAPLSEQLLIELFSETKG